MDHEEWKWQEPGTTWKGAGLYHVTMTVTSRQPLLGSLVVPEEDPKRAYVERTVLGEALIDAMFDVQRYHKEIQILHFCLMPDHLHMVWYVRQTMRKGIASVAAGFWRGAQKIGRAYTYYADPSHRRSNHEEGGAVSDRHLEYEEGKSSDRWGNIEDGKDRQRDTRLPSFFASTVSREKYQDNKLRQELGSEAYYALSPIFEEKPHVRAMSQRRQLPTTIRYIDMNPQRLATKRLMPGYFRVQEGIEIGGRKYSGVGNVEILQAAEYAPVHVRRTMVEAAERGEKQALRDYMNGCVIKARKGTVMVSPFISPQEREVLGVLMKEGWPVIVLADNGFGEYYKPSEGLFDSVAAGKVLILSPWEYEAGKRHISRAECVALNGMAEEISGQWSD